MAEFTKLSNAKPTEAVKALAEFGSHLTSTSTPTSEALTEEERFVRWAPHCSLKQLRRWIRLPAKPPLKQ